MVFRKPYAFLIKNFKKIHIIMLILCVFIYFRMNSMMGFIRDYITYGTYSSSLEPFSSKTGILFYFSLFIIIIGSFLLLVLLRRKDKPWKIYLLYISEYFFLLISVVLVSNYFASYSTETVVSGVLIYRDMLNISRYVQYPVLILLTIRVFGLDLKKFNFKNDEEFLELSSEDQEEFEVSFDFDKNSIKRILRRLKRNLSYFYQEHRFICNLVFVAFTFISIGYSYYYFGVVHRSYKQGKAFDSGIYTITVQDSYITDKDYKGNIIEKGNKFVLS